MEGRGGERKQGEEELRAHQVKNISYCSNKRWRDQRGVLEKIEEPAEVLKRRINY